MEQNISDTYRKKIESMSNQIDMDITLRALKMSPDQLKKVLDISDRFYDSAKDFDANLIDISCVDKSVRLIFEPIIGGDFFLELPELSLEDKVYLLGLLEKLS